MCVCSISLLAHNMSLEIMPTFSYKTTHRIHRKYIVLHAYLVARACQQSIDYFITSMYVAATHMNTVCLCYSILKQYAQTKWHLYHPGGKSFATVQSRNPFYCGMARTYVGTWTPWPVKMGPIGYPETSINYKHTLLNIPDKQRPQMHHEGSLKSRKTLGPSQYNELL